VQQKKLCSSKNFSLHPKPKRNEINKELRLSQFHLEAAVEKLREPKFLMLLLNFGLGREHNFIL